ncbi:MAG: secretin N-terminal domain-containing protein [Myxococcota bacterium]
MTLFRPVFGTLVALALLGVAGATHAQEPVAVYGLELEVDEDRERLLIFSGAPVTPRLVPVDDRTLMLALPGTFLDPSAPTRIVPGRQGTVRRITSFDRAEAGGAPEVRIVVQRRPGAPPSIERRASIIAVDFPAMPRLPAARQPGDRVSVAFKRAPLRQVVTQLAEATGETLIFDETLSGVLTVEGPSTVSRDEALAMLDSALLIRGFAAVPAPGGGRKIVSIQGAPGPWVTDDALPDSDTVATTLVRLETMRVEHVAPVIQPLVGAQARATSYPPTNSLILSGPASRLRRLREALLLFDDVELGQWVIWRAQFSNAENLASQVQEVVGEKGILESGFDARTNRVLLRVRPDAVERARSIVRRLDRPAAGSGKFHVVRVEHADLDRLVEILESLRDTPRANTNVAFARSLGIERAIGLQSRDFAVSADPATHSLLVRAAPDDLAAVLDVVRAIDREPTLVKVSLDILRLDLDDSLDLGSEYIIPSVIEPDSARDLIAQVSRVDAGGVLDPAAGGNLPPLVANYTRAPLIVPIVDPITGAVFPFMINRETVSFTASGRTVETDSIVRPRLLVTSGEEHEIFAGDNIPVPVSSTTDTTIATQVRQDIERYDVGTSVRITPTVGAQGTIELDLAVEVTSLSASLAGPIEDVGPTIEELSVESTILLQSGDVAILATQADSVEADAEAGVPWLSQVPFLKWAFTNTAESLRKRHILIAVEAEVVTPEALALAEQITALVRDREARAQALADESGSPEPASSQDE